MLQSEFGWIALGLGASYSVGLALFPQWFNNWILCPRWSVETPASRLTGIGEGLVLVGLGLVHLNSVFALVPRWAPWTFAGLAFVVMVAGGSHPPLYKPKP